MQRHLVNDLFAGKKPSATSLDAYQINGMADLLDVYATQMTRRRKFERQLVFIRKNPRFARLLP
jgi:hypothetical protein